MRIYIALFLSFLTIYGCDNSLEVAADWKEVPVIYGLLDPGAEYNYIRVNRAYLNTTGNALSYAKVADSIYFDSLTITLVEKRDGIEGNSIILEKVNGDDLGIPKDSGVFANVPNYLYRTKYPIKPSDFTATYEYDFVMVNEVSGLIYRAKAETVGILELLSPRRINPTVNIQDKAESFLFIEYREAPKARMYDLVFRFQYKEYPKNQPDQAEIKTLDWKVFRNKETISLRGYNDVSYLLRGTVFYEYLSAVIPVNESVSREAIEAGLIFYGGGEDLFTYVEVNEPSIGIVQKKPEFTNIDNALGIFSSRYVSVFGNFKIDDAMKSTLKTSKHTEKLNFVTP
ncbi:MAG: hypothetical protein ACI8ZN_002580 [Bacteroidia bacterium]|jgi:hypothetical protein